MTRKPLRIPTRAHKVKAPPLPPAEGVLGEGGKTLQINLPHTTQLVPIRTTSLYSLPSQAEIYSYAILGVAHPTQAPTAPTQIWSRTGADSRLP